MKKPKKTATNTVNLLVHSLEKFTVQSHIIFLFFFPFFSLQFLFIYLFFFFWLLLCRLKWLKKMGWKLPWEKMILLKIIRNGWLSQESGFEYWISMMKECDLRKFNLNFNECSICHTHTHLTPLHTWQLNNC